MGKKKKNAGQERTQNTEQSAGSSPDMTGAVVFLVAAVAAVGHAAHVYLAIDYAPAFVGLSLFLALVGWTAGGGMVEAGSFDQRNGMVGMGIALILIIAAAPHLSPPKGDASPSTTEAVSGQPGWKPSLTSDTDGSGQGPADVNHASGFDQSSATGTTQVGGAASKRAMNLLAALKNAPPPMPEGPPTEEQMTRAAASARRFFWGYVNGDTAVMEGESSLDFGEKMATVKAPAAWQTTKERVKLDAISLTKQEFDGTKIIVNVAAGENRTGKVLLTKDIDWEVTGIVAGQ